MDATNLVIPLWGALTVGATILVTIVGVVVWVFANFELKADAKERQRAFEKMQEASATRVGVVETTVNRMAQDVSYIRGILEPKK